MSEQTFRVGEIAIVQNAEGIFAHLNGTECEVTEVYTSPRIFRGDEYSYKVRCVDGRLYAAARMHLRKKRPPQSDDAWAIEKIKQLTNPINVPELEVV